MKISNLFTVLFVFSLFIMSCEKDDNGNVISESSEGILTIAGVEFDLIGGVIYDRGQHADDQGFNFDIDLYSLGVNPVTETGSGHVVAMEIFTETQDDIKAGTYIHDVDNTYPAGTFCGNILIGIDIDADTVSSWFITTSGTIEVARTESKYNFNMNLEADEYDVTSDWEFVKIDSNVVISCSYKGNLDSQ